MNLKKRNKLIANVMRQYDEGASPPLVCLDEFFDGNTDEHSLAPNHVGEQYASIKRIGTVLREIRDREDVEQVFVGVHECPEADDEADFDMWVQGEQVFIYTSATLREVKEWVRELACNWVSKWRPEKVSSIAPKPSKGFKVYALVWD